MTCVATRLQHHSPGQAFAAHRQGHEQGRTLRRENRVLREERDILKRATAFFAKETR
jgi:transposase-like protein